MDFDHNLVFNHASALAPVLLIFAMSLTIFYKLRMRWPMKVNCWFCNEDAKILRQSLDWWLCPWCEQYNGFSKTGDYSFNIPEQYTSSKCARYCKAARNIGSSPSLCMDCNERETVKLTALSNFEPRNERFYDRELKTFKKDLEEKYPVCNKCKSMVSGVLKKQALWLTRYKMLFFRQKPVKAIIHKARKWGMVFRVISITLDSVVVYNNDLMWPPVGGLFFHLCATWACSMKTNNYNTLLTFLWFCIILLTFIKNLTIPPIFWLTSEHVVQYHMITICASIIVFVSAKATSCKNTLTGSVAFKKLGQNVYDYHDEDDVLNETSSSTETASEISELNVTEVNPQLAILKQFTTIVSNNRSNANFLSQSKNGSQNAFCLDDSLSTLSLSEDSRRCSNNATATATIFERRIYNVTSSENLFRKSGNASNKRYILAPPKLRSVTQTSWVAGGYWQESMMTPPPSTLSRSSSQSSGFGSAGSSNLAFSREPSVHEFDRCSVMSDGTRSCHTPRPTHAVSANPARRGSPAPQFHSQPRFGDAATMSDHHSPSVSSPLLRATYNRENCVQEGYVSRDPDVDQRNGPMPVYPNHTTIIASPGWLSAMFCGSLVLNMIVLCTMLLHILH
ncbi:hypothetical protein DMN91_007152 [Ooceraea biroi]|uniref:Ima1 N-terminal domain-containing protein n=1 Tax=Ooceraea biroi TaxID=2015173 RepID=A0A026WFS1_OOCBI|nr:uncharacterized protein LOC105279848 [Ooceraea biroi]EZA54783.1 hypothetical protein X777_05068 [Ooceraea biroi]RLU20541.1 hypothetical protein DMN91_007152 [Ooceraea biroi]